MTLSEQRSPLEQWHRDAGARMVDFHGWQMPLHYTRVFDEVAATRERVGLFDLCHMGRIMARGSDRVEFADLIFTNSVAEMEEGQVTYGFLCNESGGVIDDVTVYRHDEYLMFVVNAANRTEVLQWMQIHAKEFDDVSLEDRTHSFSMFAVQGPRAMEVMAQLSSQPVDALKYYHFKLARILGHLCLISRTGYTGEDGAEIYIASAFAEETWAALVTAAEHFGGVPVGLAARDTLRLEAGFPLHGQELSPSITPIEAGLDRFLAFEKKRFLGRNPLLDSTNSDISMRLVGFEMLTRAIPRTGHAICHRDHECGRVTSGGYSPTIERGIGMGYVDQALSKIGTGIQIRSRGQFHPAVIVKRPFHKRGKK